MKRDSGKQEGRGGCMGFGQGVRSATEESKKTTERENSMQLLNLERGVERDSRGDCGKATDWRSLSTAEMFERALGGGLSDEEVYSSASAVVDAALWSELGRDLGDAAEVSPGELLKDSLFGSGDGGAGMYFREPRTPDRREKMVASLISHPERTRRLFRS